MRWLLILALGLPLAACEGDTPGNPDSGGGGGDGGVDASTTNPLTGMGNVELVKSGYEFTEGPQWHPGESVMLFTDIPASTIYKYTPGGGDPTVFRMPSGQANGLAIDAANLVVAAQHNTHSVTRDGVEIVSVFENQRLNSPNDVVVAEDGTIYFTDPPYGLPSNTTGQPHMGVYRIAPNNDVTAEHRGATTERPNGIGLSLDGKTLYVADTADGKLWAFPVQATGALGTRTMLAQTTGGADGLAIDSAGNIYVTSTTGVEVFAPSGTKWGTISVTNKASNCAFGDADKKTLYITTNGPQATDGALYKVRLEIAGAPNN